MDSFAVFLLVLVLINIVFHSISLYVLLKMRSYYERNIQLVYLGSICCNEFLNCLISAAMFVIRVRYNDSTSNEIEHYFNMVRGNVIFMSYFLTMIALLLDKVLQVLLDINYTVYWNLTKANNLILGIWFFSFLQCTIVFILYFAANIRIMTYFAVYIILGGGITFVVSATISNCYLFYKFRKSRIRPFNNNNRQQSMTRWFSVFKKSRFFIPVMLITIYVLFQLTPAIVYTILVYKTTIDEKNLKIVRLYMAISFNIALLFDSILFIFFEPVVKKFVKKEISNLKVRNNVANEQSRRWREFKRSRIRNITQVSPMSVNEERKVTMTATQYCAEKRIVDVLTSIFGEGNNNRNNING